MLLFILFLLFSIYYLYIRFSLGITRSATCLLGKTAIITGANSGLGYQTTLNLASRGCRVIMADVENMEKSKQNVINYTKNTNIVTKHLDLSSFKSVRKFAEDIIKNEEHLHILINNAGVGLAESYKTEDGLNSVLQINYFGHFLLTHLLINLLKKSSPSRIIFSSSCLAFIHNLTQENLTTNVESKSFIQKITNYNNSKFALLIASDIFAEKLKGSGVTSNSIHPGYVSTDIFQKSYSHVNILFSSLQALYNLFFSKDPWEGSQVIVHVAVSEKLENVTGKYFWDCKPFLKPRAAYNKDFCAKIWQKSEELALTPEEVLSMNRRCFMIEINFGFLD